MAVSAHHVALADLGHDYLPCTVGPHHVGYVPMLGRVNMVKVQHAGVIDPTIGAPHGCLVNANGSPLDGA